MSIVKLFATGFILSYFGGCLAGCQSAGSLTPEQIASIDALAKTASNAARENDVVVFGQVTLRPVAAYEKIEFGLSGLEAQVFIFANAADDEQVGPNQ